MEKIFCDIAIIGGGPAGMMSAISATSNNKKIVLIEKNDVLGKKLLLTGGTRCNITNALNNKNDFIAQYGKRGDFLQSGFSLFDNKKTLEFFAKIGIRVKEENGKIFPKTDNAKDVLNALLAKIRSNGVKIIENAPITKIVMENDKIAKIITSKKQEIIAKNYILATGGKSYPNTGSSGDGYKFAFDMGHKIIDLKPILVPIKTKELWPKNLQGIAISNVRITFKQKNKKNQKQGDIIFTHFGIGGPLAMDISRDIVDDFKNLELLIDLLPDFDLKSLDKRISNIFLENQTKSISNSLKLIFAQRLADFLLEESGINPDLKCSQISKKEKTNLIKKIKSLGLTVDSLLGFECATATKGGIDLNEIDSKTMKSKKIENLFFAGEIIDLAGPCGGFNLQMCWTTGYLAGLNASK